MIAIYIKRTIHIFECIAEIFEFHIHCDIEIGKTLRCLERISSGRRILKQHRFGLFWRPVGRLAASCAHIELLPHIMRRTAEHVGNDYLLILAFYVGNSL